MLILWIIPVLAVLCLLAMLACWHMAFYVPPRKPGNKDIVETPEGKIYDPYREKMEQWVRDARALPHEEVQITSFKLRSMSVDLTSAMPGADFSIFNGKQMQIVMKDGEEIPILDKTYFDPIDLDQVDYVLFPDGTKLPVSTDR